MIQWSEAVRMDRRLNNADDLRTRLALDAVFAWRAFDVHKAAVTKPDG